MVLGGRVTPTASINNKRESIASNSTAIPNSTNVSVVLRIRPNSGPDPSIPTRFQRTVIHPLTPTTLQIEGGTSNSTLGGQSSISSSSSLGGNSNASGSKSNKATFTFDRVIGPEEGQSAVYECAESLVESFMEGMNSTILAYGQTASGKSYTMGTDRSFEDQDEYDDDRNNSGDEENQDRLGITPRAVTAIFERMREIQREGKGKITFSTKLSYVEIYNEDLIDLLAEDLEVKPTVQIREDKAGNIIWSGLREIKVNSAADVMKNLAIGSALRQTNATDMNAQSSRSHAIFSLTLTQRRYAGNGSPLPPPSPSSSRGGPRQSLLPNRANTPTNNLNGRPGSILRPSSSSGPRSSVSTPTPFDDFSMGGSKDTEGWISVSSKFHFVDLAGSERLKRTAAQGERVKEGISINSGLHALGNVISALGDPARARQTTHIPYRDSKLTRLLQDSLGGNSQTMMVACVSPSEFNLNETISTVKYANRARNIKNRAEINEIEVGWDDVEYLQRSITRLRLELVALKTGEGLGEDGLPPSRNGSTGEMPQRYASFTSDLSKARASVSSSTSTGTNNNSTTSTISRDDFARAVEPIVEEYEKSLSALESQLSLTKAALSHSEDEMRDLENRIEEETRGNEISGALIVELKSRVVRLTEREATTEAYVRDLEGKLKDYDDLDEKRGSAVSDLRKEITRSREQAEKTEQYIKDLEFRHTKTDDTTASLQRQIQVLERDIERREEANRDLESRLNLLDTSGDHKLLLAEIDERDQRVLELERSLDELKSKNIASELEAARLQKIAEEEKEANSELAIQVRTFERAQTISPTSTTFQSMPLPSLPDPVLLSRIDELQATYDKTFAELEITNVKYKESLREISDLNSQLEESKLINLEDGDTTPPPSTIPDDLETYLSPTVTNSSPSRSPRARRSGPLSPQNLQQSFLSRGQSTHPRSASLSQELSSAQDSQSSSSLSGPRLSPNLQQSRDMSTSPGGTRSYEQINGEVLRLQEALNDREEEIMVLESRLHQLHASNSLSPGSSPPIGLLPAFKSPPRSLIDRSMMTPSPRNSVDNFDLSPATLADIKTEDALRRSSSLSSGGGGLEGKNSVRLDGIMRSMARKESVHKEAIDALTESLMTLRRQHEELTTLSRDQVLNMSTEIEALRTQLEDQPDAASVEWRLKLMQDELDAKEVELEGARTKAETDLDATSARLTEDLRNALETLASEHSVSLQGHEERVATLQFTLAEREETLRQKEGEYTAALEVQSRAHVEALQSQSVSHEALLNSKLDQIAILIQKKKEEQEEILRRHNFAESDQIVQHSSELEQLKLEHANTIDTVQASHQTEIDQLLSDHSAILANRDTTHTAALSELQILHESKLEEAIRSHSEALDQLKLNHDAAILTLQEQQRTSLGTASNEYAERSRKVEEAHLQEIDTRRRDHEAELSTQGSIHSSTLAVKISDLEALHAAALLSLSTSSDLILQSTRKDLEERHTFKLSQLQSEHDDALQSQLTRHSDDVASLNTNHSSQISELNSSIALLKQEHSSSLSQLSESHVEAISALTAKHQEILASNVTELNDAHLSEIATLRHEHETSRRAQSFSKAAELEAKSTSLESEHVTALANLSRSQKDTYEKQSRDLESTHSTAVNQLQFDHQASLDAQTSAHQATVEAQTSAHAKKFESQAAKASMQAAALLTLASSRDSEQQSRILEAHTSEVSNLQGAHSSEMTNLREAHATEIANLHLQQESALEQASTNSVDLERQLSSLKDEHATSISQLTASQEQLLSDLYATHEAIISNSEKEFKEANLASLASLQSQHSAELLAQSSESEALLHEKLSELSISHEKTLSNLSTCHQEAIVDLASTHEVALDLQLQGLNKQHAIALAALQSTHDSEIEAQSLTNIGSLDEKLATLVAQHTETLSTLNSDHSIALDNQTQTTEESHSKEIVELTTAHKKNLEQQSQSLTEAHALEFYTLRKQQDIVLQDVASTHSTAISSLAKKHDDKLEESSELADSELRAQMQRISETQYKELASLRSSNATVLALQSSTSKARLQEQLTGLASQHDLVLKELSAGHEEKVHELAEVHSAALLEVFTKHGIDIEQLKESHNVELKEVLNNHSKDLTSQIAAVELVSVGTIAMLNRQHSEAMNSLEDSHKSSLNELQSQHLRAIEETGPDHDAAIYSLQVAHKDELEKSQIEIIRLRSQLTEHDDTVEQYSSLQMAHQELLAQHIDLSNSISGDKLAIPSNDSAMVSELQEALDALSTLEKALVESQDAREKLLLQVSDLKANARQQNRSGSTESGPSESLTSRNRSASTSHKEDNPPTATSITAPQVNSRNTNGNSNSFEATATTPDTSERSDYFSNGILPAIRLDTRIAVPPSNPPPPTPPPSMAPPALPRTASSRTPCWHNPPGMTPPRAATNPENLIFKINEQEASITRLTKQLTHCETDLQSNIDLVNTLESALNDSERSLRKARAQMNDMAKDRDTLRFQNEELRLNIANAQDEVDSVRHNSIQVQSRLQEERNGKERAKAELEKRLEEMNRNKKNKCKRNKFY